VNVKNFRVFGSNLYIKREHGGMGMFDSRVDKGILVGYSSTRKTYKFLNIRIKKIVESINVTFDETSGQRIKDEEKDSIEQIHEEDAKEEEVEEEEDEEE
jgi:hypothetical protein